jgi:hypothetical protein
MDLPCNGHSILQTIKQILESNNGLDARTQTRTQTMEWTQEQKRLFDKFETSWRVCETLVGHPQHCYKKTERNRDEETERHRTK